MKCVNQTNKLLLICGIVLLVMSGRDVSGETLQEALALAFKNNPELQAARERLKAVDETLSIASSRWKPGVSLNGNVNRSRSKTEIKSAIGSGALFRGGTTLRTSQTTSLAISQPIFRGFRTIAGTAEARANISAQEAGLKATEQTILLEASTAYLDVLKDTSVVDLRINNVQVLTRQLEATRDRFSVGEITRTDVAQAEARRASSISARILAEGNLLSSRATYLSVIGVAAEDLVSPNIFSGFPRSRDDAISAAEKNNLSLIAAGFASEAAVQRLKAVQGELLPSVSLEGQLSKAWNTIADRSTADTTSARVTVSLPLYQGGANYARLRQSRHTARQLQFQADQALLSARESATTAWESDSAARASIEAIKSQIAASSIALEGVQRESEVGSRTVLDVLDAEQELLDAKVGLVRAERDQFVSTLVLLSAIGALTGDSLGLVN
jgi:outer membrane protein